MSRMAEKMINIANLPRTIRKENGADVLEKTGALDIPRFSNISIVQKEGVDGLP